MSVLSKDEIELVAQQELESFCANSGLACEDYRITVTPDAYMHNVWLVYVDQLQMNEDRKIGCWSTGIHVCEKQDVLRVRLQDEFKRPMTFLGLFETKETAIR